MAVFGIPLMAIELNTERNFMEKETDRYTVLSTNDIPTFNSGGSFLNKYFNVKYDHFYFIVTFKWT